MSKVDMVPATPAQRRAVRLEQAERSMEGAPVRKGDRVLLQDGGEWTVLAYDPWRGTALVGRDGSGARRVPVEGMEVVR